MGDRNHLHVCRHCGIVHATSSATGPKKCAVCDAAAFSGYELNGLLRARGDPDVRPNRADDGRTERISLSGVRQ